ncbi:MAG: hypothetical protein EPO26_12660 [Chloroflexota bacterium]|nr:MAG: hypothetical protein EPO26_12660 [Chloroflexota bacterium]
MIRLVLLDRVARALESQLARSAPNEEGAFCVLREGRGERGTRLIVPAVLATPPDAWEAQGPDTLRPSARWVSEAVSRAVTAKAGLLFVHSHPNALHPPGLSPVDEVAFAALGRTVSPIIDGPFAVAVVHPSGWSAAVWTAGGYRHVDRVQSIGRTLRFLSPLPQVTDSPLDARQRDALGVVHDRLRHLHVAVVGSGGLGSTNAEQVQRMGVAGNKLVDPDVLDTPSNARRVFGSTARHLEVSPAPRKVDVVADHLDQMELGPRIERVAADVRCEAVARKLLDADVVLNGTDTHGSRASLNDLMSAYFLPVVDAGVRAGSRAGNLLNGLVTEVRVLTPTTPCFWCRGVVNSDVIRDENLPAAEFERRRREGYTVDGVREPAPSAIALTVLGSGMTTCALLTLLAEDGEDAPSGYWFDGFFGDAAETKPTEPKETCRCRQVLGLGDTAALCFL